MFFKQRRSAVAAPAILLLFAQFSAAQDAQPQRAASRTEPWTLEQAINYSLAHYPAVRVEIEKLEAARSGISLAQTAYLPSANVLWQGNRATRNNIFGALLPQSVIPSISGPALPDTSNANVWGSAAGCLVSWEPFDFGSRRANVNAARANETAASADLQLSQLNVAIATANAFFSLAATEQAVRAAQADVDRRQVLAKSIHTLVDNQLRPGADASRADADLAASRVGLIQTQTAERVSRAILADFLGVSAKDIHINAGPLLQTPAQPSASGAETSDHPAAKAQGARVALAASQLHTLERSYFPRFALQSALSGRGTGANTDGSTAGGTTGLDLQRQNWAVGLTATFPIMDFFAIRARKQIAAAGERGEAARYQQTIQDLTSDMEQADAALDGARQVAEATPIELQAARDTERQARARYQSGLATIVEISEAQSLLVRAEVDDLGARLNTWRALTSVAAAQGSLEPLLQPVRSLPSGGDK